MADFDWSHFTVRINVKASAEKLYWCWATKHGIEFWFLRKSDYKKADGTVADTATAGFKKFLSPVNN